MKSIKANKKTLELMARHEEVIGKLYSQYATKLKDSDFWNQISNDEYEHASWIRKLGQKIDDQTVFFDENRFDDAAIASDIEFLTSKTRTISEIDLEQALKDALRIEEDMIEKGYFEVIQTDSSLLKKLLNQLKEATVKHQKELKSELEKYYKTI